MAAFPLSQPIAYASFDGDPAGPKNVRTINCQVVRNGGLYVVTLGTAIAPEETVYRTASVWKGLRATILMDADPLTPTVRTFIFAGAGFLTDDFSARICFNRVIHYAH